MRGYIYNDWQFAGTPTSYEFITSGIVPVDISSFELPYETAQGTTGRVVIVGDLKHDYSNHIIRINNKMYHIKQSSSISGGNTTLTIGDDASMFDDTMMFAPKDKTAFDYFLAAFPSYYYDPDFSSVFPYMYGRPKDFKCVTNDYTLLEQLREIPIDVESIMFDGVESIVQDGVTLYPVNVAKLLRQLRLNGIVIDYSVDRTVLGADVSNIVKYSKEMPIFDKDGHSSIISADFSNNVCSYVWVINSTQTMDYVYANIDGLAVNVRTTFPYPEPSRLGFTSIIQDKTVRTEADAKALAQAEIDKNTFNHKIVFESDKELHIGQPVCVCLDRGNYHSVISSVFKKSNTDRLQYTCGDLPVTASDLIRDNAWSYNGIPKNPRKGQLIFV